jgi:hypothetical protein
MPRWLTNLILLSPWATLIPVGMSMSGAVEAQPAAQCAVLAADGFDWPASRGAHEPVMSIARGRVVSSTEDGSVLRIHHCTRRSDGTLEEIESSYGPLSLIGVRPGDVVERGQVIGQLGTAPLRLQVEPISPAE